jgi:hypothetical protein
LTPVHLGTARMLVIDRIEPDDQPAVLRALAAMLEALGDSWSPTSSDESVSRRR